MRIDKFLSSAGAASRKEAARAAKAGEVLVDGRIARDLSAHIDPDTQIVVFRGETVVYQEHVYIMLNKPAGYVSSTDPKDGQIVTLLLDDRLRRRGLFPCGRLDRDTEGLLLLTDDGPLAHRLLSPRHHAEKTYFFRCTSPIGEPERLRLESGVEIGEARPTLPARVELLSPTEGRITLTEGKYHQIKRMLEAVGSSIVYLERVVFAGIPLDPALERGQWRPLRPDEEQTIKANS